MILLSPVVAAGDQPIARDGDGMLQRLRTDQVVLEQAEQDYRGRVERGGMSAKEISDYESYLDRLRSRMARDCMVLAETSVAPLPSDLPCFEAHSAVPARIDQQSEQTLDERGAAFDAQLNSSLGDFDEMLLREQERVKAAAPLSDAAMGGGGADGEGDSTEVAEGDQTASGSGEVSAASPDGAPGDATTGETRGPEGASIGGARPEGGPQPTAARSVPPDIPDGSDDDVVARQLREAAQKETDPELKRRLWDEYRKYKQGTR